MNANWFNLQQMNHLISFSCTHVSVWRLLESDIDLDQYHFNNGFQSIRELGIIQSYDKYMYVQACITKVIKWKGSRNMLVVKKMWERETHFQREQALTHRTWGIAPGLALLLPQGWLLKVPRVQSHHLTNNNKRSMGHIAHLRKQFEIN